MYCRLASPFRTVLYIINKPVGTRIEEELEEENIYVCVCVSVCMYTIRMNVQMRNNREDELINIVEGRENREAFEIY